MPHAALWPAKGWPRDFDRVAFLTPGLAPLSRALPDNPLPRGGACGTTSGRSGG